MRLLFNKLSIAWLTLALIVAPLQATALPVALSAGSDCPLMQDNQSNLADYLHHGISHALGDQAASPCANCVDHSCDDGQCAGNGCYSVHSQLSLPGSLPSFDGRPAVENHPDFSDSPASMTPTPLLRPPVV